MFIRSSRYIDQFLHVNPIGRRTFPPLNITGHTPSYHSLIIKNITNPIPIHNPNHNLTINWYFFRLSGNSSSEVMTLWRYRNVSIIRPADRYVGRPCLIGLNAAVSFSPDSFTSTPRIGRPSNVYHRFSRRVYSIFSPSILSTPPLMLRGGQKM